MNQKERLIDILEKFTTKKCKITHGCGYCDNDELAVCASAVAEHLIANGVIVPPCKVGQSVFLVFTPKYPANPSDKGKWFLCQDGVQRIIYGAKGLSIETWNMGTIPEKEIGKKLFFDKAEAEKAIAERSK